MLLLLLLLYLLDQVSSHTYLALERVFGIGTFLLLWCVQISYSSGHQVVPYTEELISRPILDEKSIRQLF